MAQVSILLLLVSWVRGQVLFTPDPVIWQYGQTSGCDATGASRCGPDEWVKVSEDCGREGLQSPINLPQKDIHPDVAGVPTPALLEDGRYSCRTEVAKEDLHTTNIIFEGDCLKRYGLSYQGKRYSLSSFHFHSPSEHTIDGQHYDAEMHIISVDEEGVAVVIAVLLSLGPENVFLTQFWDEWTKLGQTAGRSSSNETQSSDAKENIDNIDIDAFQAFAGLSGFYMYEGSLTTPPCTTGVHWVVFKQASTISLEQLRAYQAAIKAMPNNQLNLRETASDSQGAPPNFLDTKAAMSLNDRPVQPVGNRTIHFVQGALAQGNPNAVLPGATAAPGVTLLVQQIICAVAACYFVVNLFVFGRRPKTGLFSSAVGEVAVGQLFKDNLYSATSVGLLSIPLSIALGIACGTSPTVGLASAVFGGIAAGSCSSSKHNVVGPAGALAGMLSMYAMTWGPNILPWIAFLSSLIVFTVSSLGLHQYLLIMPKSVFEGFTVSVAISISGGQINNFLGTVPPRTYPYLVLNIWEALMQIPNCDLTGVILGTSTLVLLLVLFRWKPKQPWLVYATFIHLAIGLLDAYGYLGLGLKNLKSKFGMLSGTVVFEIVPIYQIVNDYNGFFTVFLASLSIAYVAMLETLISAKIAVIRTGVKFDEAKECRGLSIAHFMCGIAGLMPVTGVFVRTSVNQSSGATHGMSQFLAASFVFVILVIFMPVFSFLPMVAVAAVLFVACIRMVPWGYIKDLVLYSKVDFILLVLTAALSVLLDSSRGLMCGMAVALLRNARHQQQYNKPFVQEHGSPNIVSYRSWGANIDEDVLQPQDELTRNLLESEVAQRPITLYRHSGNLTYITAEAFFNQHPKGLVEGQGMVLSLEAVNALDLDGVEAIKKLVDTHKHRSVELVIADFDARNHALLKKFEWFEKMVEEGLVFETNLDGTDKRAEDVAVLKVKDLLRAH